MGVLQHVVAPDGVAAGRGYSQVVTGQGRLVVVDTTPPPANTAVQVAALFAPGYLLEAEAWALIGD
jgi:enamine deaminase RidA (YjgF/YER057c/UK114 family)